jgi:predicted dehydrogenase
MTQASRSGNTAASTEGDAKTTAPSPPESTTRPAGVSRREFVGNVAMAGAAFHIVPRHVLGRGYTPPSDKINFACIGVGGQGHSDVHGFSVENIYALCDVDLHSAEDSLRSFPQAKRYRDYREMLDKEAKNIDAVTVTIPDHSHAAASLLAIRAGKHVYCQKPLARTLGEVRTMAAEAARRPKQMTIMGNQGHSMEGTRQIREWIEAGAIGTVREVHFFTNRPIWPQALDRPLAAYNVPPWMDWNLWIGPSPDRPYAPQYAPFNWRGWYDWGTGAMGDMACHIMDAAVWTLGLHYPSRIIPESTKLYSETWPKASRITYEFAATPTRNALTLVWRDGNFNPPRPPDWPDSEDWPYDDSGQLWIGDKGTMIAGTYGEDPRLSDPKKNAEWIKNPPPVKYARVVRIPGGIAGDVHSEFINSIRSGTQPGSNWPGHAGPLTEMVQLGNLAVRMGETLEIDANGQVTNVKVPTEYIQPAYRAGWTL